LRKLDQFAVLILDDVGLDLPGRAGLKSRATANSATRS